MTIRSPTGSGGRGVIRVRAVTFGDKGSRRAIELAGSHLLDGQWLEVCQPGIRVQSWLEVRQLVP
jgi:hypothetical protein